MTREITQAGLDLIAKDEGLRLTAYMDIAGIWSIGYGHTPAQSGETITQGQALALLRQDVGSAATAVDGATHDVPTTDNEFSAMVSLAFNIGNGAFRRSTVLAKHRGGDHYGAAEAFLMWDKAHVDGSLVVVPGLLRRRSEERSMYLEPQDATVAPAQPPDTIGPDLVRRGDIDAAAHNFDIAVRELQAYLKTARLYAGEVDGDFGPESRAALARYKEGQTA